MSPSPADARRPASVRRWCLRLLLAVAPLLAAALEPIPDKLVVLTFDDSVASHHAVVAPLLRKHGFGATFFITEGFSFRTNKVDYLTWEQIAALHRQGFEVGNHTRDHLGVSADTLGLFRQQLRAIEERCAEHGIPRPTSFAYPGNAIHPGAVALLSGAGYRFARRGGQPEFPYERGEGRAYEPGLDHPLLVPTAGDARPVWTLADLRRAAGQARHGRVAVLQFHGVPDRDHPWVNTPPERFAEYLDWLSANGYRAIALRDLARFVDPSRAPSDPLAAIEERRVRPRVLTPVTGRVVDAASGRSLPARVLVRDAAGVRHAADTLSPRGSAREVAGGTALSADPFELRLPPGHYVLQADGGRERMTGRVSLEVGVEPVEVRVPLRPWVRLGRRP